MLAFPGCRLFEARQVVAARETVDAAGRTNTIYTTNFVYTVNAAATNAMTVARDIASDVGGPWGALAGGALAIATAVVSAIARRKRQQASLLVAAIETASTNEAVKREVEKMARATGLENSINATVRKVTSRLNVQRPASNPQREG